MTSDAELGKAWKAFFAFNRHSRKSGRLPLFEPKRWLAVVHAVNGGTKTPTHRAKALASPENAKRSKEWTKQQRERFARTIAKRKSS